MVLHASTIARCQIAAFQGYFKVDVRLLQAGVGSADTV